MATLRKAMVAAAALSVLCPPARGDDANFRPYLVGARAAGMGGAFTALADDGSGGYYNPGGLAFINRSSISLSGSIYGIVRGTYADLLQQGSDFTYSALNIFPVSTTAVRKLGDTILHLSVFVPDAVRIDERQSILAKTNAFAYAVESQTLWLGGGVARRFGPVGIGATLHALIGSETNQLDLNVINPQDAGRFVAITDRQDLSTVGFVAGLGVRIDATEELHFGLSVYLPAIGWGSRKVFIRVLAGRDVGQPGNPPTSAVRAEDGLSATPSLPLRAQAGAAFTRDRLTLAADLIYLAAREVSDDPDKAAIGLDRHIVRRPVLNASIGFEYLAADHIPVRAGLFTDFAATQSPDDLGSGVRPYNTLHINRYGLSASVGYRAEHVNTDLGLNLSYGTGTEYLPVQLDFNNIQPASATQLFAYIFLATSYEF
jgi:hypothetical protein